VSFAQKWAAVADKLKNHLWETTLPKKYQQHHKVFSEQLVKQLPLNWIEDMTITLKEGSPDQLDCITYPLSWKETKVLREAIEEDLKKGFINMEHLPLSHQSSLYQRKMGMNYAWSSIIISSMIWLKRTFTLYQTSR
jgi:hypothetical protein